MVLLKRSTVKRIARLGTTRDVEENMEKEAFCVESELVAHALVPSSLPCSEEKGLWEYAQHPSTWRVIQGESALDFREKASRAAVVEKGGRWHVDMVRG